MFIKNPAQAIEDYKKEIVTLQNDLEKIENNVSEKTLNLIKNAISAKERSIKEAELDIRYTDYQ